jgi:2-polyprenyl-3-methyl-5-hydroxy-6-metoxy-1,4-benzoquinol methylase
VTTTLQWPSISEFLSDWLQADRLAPAEQHIFDRYYARYKKCFPSYVREHYAAQTNELVDLLKKANGAARPALLEVGSGCGTEALWFALLGADVTSIDVSEKRLRVARARKQVLEQQLGRPLSVEFKNNSFFRLGQGSAYDLVWMEQTFHHLEPRPEVYACIAGALKPGGHAVISETNGWNLFVQAQHFLQRGFRTKIQKRAADGSLIEYGNERITVPGVIAKGLRNVGLEPEVVRYFRMLPNRDWSRRVQKREAAVPAFMRPLLTTHYNIVCRKPAR